MMMRRRRRRSQYYANCIGGIISLSLSLHIYFLFHHIFVVDKHNIRNPNKSDPFFFYLGYTWIRLVLHA
jgi:hypothetical protein